MQIQTTLNFLIPIKNQLHSKKLLFHSFYDNIVFFLVSTKYICKNIEKLLRYTLSCIDLSYLERVIILSDPPIKSSGSAPGRVAGR